MALNKATLKASIKTALLDELPAVSGDQSAALERIATKVSNAIDVYVKSATLTVPAGIPASVNLGIGGTANGATTAPGTGQIT